MKCNCPGFIWILRNRVKDREIGQFTDFNEAMESLAERSGKWNLREEEIHKGDYYIVEIRRHH